MLSVLLKNLTDKKRLNEVIDLEALRLFYERAYSSLQKFENYENPIVLSNEVYGSFSLSFSRYGLEGLQDAKKMLKERDKKFPWGPEIFIDLLEHMQGCVNKKGYDEKITELLVKQFEVLTQLGYHINKKPKTLPHVYKFWKLCCSNFDVRLEKAFMDLLKAHYAIEDWLPLALEDIRQKGEKRMSIKELGPFKAVLEEESSLTGNAKDFLNRCKVIEKNSQRSDKIKGNEKPFSSPYTSRYNQFYLPPSYGDNNRKKRGRYDDTNGPNSNYKKQKKSF